jgi:hypothetical protein
MPLTYRKKIALGLASIKTKIPKDFITEDPLTPLYPGEVVVGIGTEPCQDIEEVEKLSPAINRRPRMQRKIKRPVQGQKRRRPTPPGVAPEGQEALKSWLESTEGEEPDTDLGDLSETESIFSNEDLGSEFF